MTTKLEWGGGGEGLRGPLAEELFFGASLTYRREAV